MASARGAARSGRPSVAGDDDQRHPPGPQRHALAGGAAAGAGGQKCAEPWEVVIADNGSTDGSRELAQRVVRAPHEDFRCVDASGLHGARGRPATPACGRPRASCWPSVMPTTRPAGWLACVRGGAGDAPTWWPGSSTSGPSTGSPPSPLGTGRHPPAGLPPRRAGRQPGRAPSRLRAGRRVHRGAAPRRGHRPVLATAAPRASGSPSTPAPSWPSGPAASSARCSTRRSPTGAAGPSSTAGTARRARGGTCAVPSSRGCGW